MPHGYIHVASKELSFDDQWQRVDSSSTASPSLNSEGSVSANVSPRRHAIPPFDSDDLDEGAWFVQCRNDDISFAKQDDEEVLPEELTSLNIANMEEATQLELEHALVKRLPQYTAKEIVKAWAAVFEHMVTSVKAAHLTVFDSSAVPAISVEGYFERISKFFQCSEACLIIGPVLIDRVTKLHADLKISKLNIHRLLATSIMVVAKYHDDVYYSNSYYAKVAGIPLKEMNRLEAAFLGMIRWELRVTADEFESYLGTVLPAKQ
jgi:hypothetical protein